jgi:hypothetical protein
MENMLQVGKQKGDMEELFIILDWCIKLVQIGN